jgi:hypothetical protein
VTTTIILTDEQMAMVRTAAAPMRLSARDRFMLDLASELARCHSPVSDLDVRICIRKLLGVVTGQVT